jgi:hypothetical protein
MSNTFLSTDTVVGNYIAVAASIISITGVIFNNAMLEHTMAMWIWTVSNFLFIIFFFGQYIKLWNSGLSSATICITYVIMFVTGIYGLVQIG